jgi:hypothetical protein
MLASSEQVRVVGKKLKECLLGVKFEGAGEGLAGYPAFPMLPLR